MKPVESERQLRHETRAFNRICNKGIFGGFRPISVDAMPRGFTRQQQTVIKGLFTGQTNPEIAKSLGASVQMVKNHIGRIGFKLGISGSNFCVRVRIVYLIALHNGLVPAFYDPNDPVITGESVVSSDGVRAEEDSRSSAAD